MSTLHTPHPKSVPNQPHHTSLLTSCSPFIIILVGLFVYLFVFWIHWVSLILPLFMWEWGHSVRQEQLSKGHMLVKMTFSPLKAQLPIASHLGWILVSPSTLLDWILNRFGLVSVLGGSHYFCECGSSVVNREQDFIILLSILWLSTSSEMFPQLCVCVGGGLDGFSLTNNS